MKFKRKQDLIQDPELLEQELKEPGNTKDIRTLNAPGGHNN
jgi:hypothetical protein